jgi:hypothetical protein
MDRFRISADIASRPIAVSYIDFSGTALFHRGDDIVLTLLLELHVHGLPDR